MRSLSIRAFTRAVALAAVAAAAVVLPLAPQTPGSLSGPRSRRTPASLPSTPQQEDGNSGGGGGGGALYASETNRRHAVRVALECLKELRDAFIPLQMMVDAKVGVWRTSAYITGTVACRSLTQW
jgi:hypothetical protein